MAIYLMLVIGVFGYLLRKLGFSMPPVILGYVLGGLMEDNLRRALSISGGDLGILWQSGISLGLWIAAALLLVVPDRPVSFGVFADDFAGMHRQRNIVEVSRLRESLQAEQGLAGRFRTCSREGLLE